MTAGGWTILAEGLGFTESPVWTGGQRLVVASVNRGAIYEAFLDAGPARRLVEVGGGPNGLSVDEEGTIWIAQNGGSAMASRSSLAARPSLQKLPPGGELETLSSAGFTAPSDCIGGPDGRLWLTDPADHRLDGRAQPGRLWAVDRETGDAELVAADIRFPNGLAFSPDGRLYVAESGSGRILRYSATATGWSRDRWSIALDGGVPDGVAVAPDGVVWVAGSFSHSLFRISPDTRKVSEVVMPGEPFPTALCFAGEAGERVVVTAARGGRVLATSRSRIRSSTSY